MFGLDSLQWTAIGTCTLVLVTLAYVVITHTLAKHAGSSAEAARESAVAARDSAAAAARAAEATSRYVAVAEAGLDVRFLVKYVEEEEEMTSSCWLTVACVGSNVFVHALEILGFASPTYAGKPRFIAGQPEALEPRKAPAYLHGGEEMVFQWPGPRIGSNFHAGARAKVSYSILAEDPPRKVSTTVHFPDTT